MIEKWLFLQNISCKISLNVILFLITVVRDKQFLLFFKLFVDDVSWKVNICFHFNYRYMYLYFSPQN